MPIFPEEDLTSPAGYYQGSLDKTLDSGHWKIIRKLGWGPQSSTWLAKDLHGPDNIEAIKIFTISATGSSEASNERKILQRLSNLHVISGVPVIRGHFYEESEKGKHLCLVLHVLGGSVDSFRSKNVDGAYLPLHITKKIISDVVDVLAKLHEHNIVHGAVTPDNILFDAPQQARDIEEYISSHPTTTAQEVIAKNGVSYHVISSQPLVEDIQWYTPAAEFANETLYLSNFKYAKTGRTSATAVPSPESTAGNRIDQKTDIWLLGYMAYVLLTGTSPLPFKGNVTLETLQSFVENLPSTLPQTLSSIHGFSAEDVPATVEFITACLALDPNARPSTGDLMGFHWVQNGMICSCG
ncbi:kinase-like domain-containing protein [Cyathus striatus]|nr:kinase-like domain-containing protein [Cyathus striatus]